MSLKMLQQRTYSGVFFRMPLVAWALDLLLLRLPWETHTSSSLSAPSPVAPHSKPLVPGMDTVSQTITETTDKLWTYRGVKQRVFFTLMDFFF